MPHLLPRHRVTTAAWVIAAGVILMAVILRPGATSTGPVLAEISADLSLTPTAAAALAAFPALAFALSGAMSARLGHIMGVAGGLVMAAGLSTIGLLTRAATDSQSVFLSMTMLALMGAGIGNVLLPSAIKQRFPLHSQRWTSIYVVVLSLGTIAPQLLAPALAGDSGEWRPGLALWGWVSAAAVMPWLLTALGDTVGRRRRLERAAVARDSRDWAAAARAAAEQASLGYVHGLPRRRRETPRGRRRTHVEAGTRPAYLDDPAAPVTMRMVLSSRRARAMGAFFGCQSAQAYVAFGWLPQIYRDHGMDSATASYMVAIFSGLGVLGAFLVPALVGRSNRLPLWVLGFVSCSLGGYLGLLLAPTTLPALWPTLLGLGGFCFPVCLVLFTARTRDYRVTAALAGFAQSAGYALASVLSFAVGWVHGLVGGWTAPLALMIASLLPMAWAGMRASARGTIDDELRFPQPAVPTA